MRKKLIFSFLAFAFSIQPLVLLRAAEQDVGTSGAQFLKLGVGNPKALSLGRAYTAMAKGVESLGYNPAGLALSNSNEFAIGMTEYVQDLRGHYLAFSHPFLRSNIGFNGAYLTMGDFDARDENGLPLSGTNVFARMGYINGAFAWSLPTERLFLGVGAKAIMEDYAGDSTMNFVADTGVLWKPSGPLKVGASLVNLGFDAKKVPWSLRTGAAYSFPEYVTLTMDMIQDRDSKVRLGTGINVDVAESKDIGLVSMRVGYFTADNQGESKTGFLKSFKLQRTSGISYGVGVETTKESLYNFGFDYALVPLGALGMAHHIAIKFAF